MKDLTRSARWIALPAAVLLLALVGMALSAGPGPDGESAGTPQAEPIELEERQFEEQPGPTDGDDLGTNTPDAPSVTVSSTQGDIEIRFDPGGVARLSVNDDNVVTEFDLVQGTESGLRVDDEGRLEPVPPSKIGEDDLGFTPSGNGVDILAPGNPVVELRPDGIDGGVSATEFDGENANPLEPDNGIVELNDGTTISPVEPPRDEFLDTAPNPQMPWRWLFTTIAVLALTSATVGYLLHRNYREADLTIETAPGATRIDENFEQFLARLAADPNPTRAIRLGFHAVEQGLGGLPDRKDNETPFEWHQRVGKTVPAVEGTLGQICDLFAKARFAPGDATVEDRQRMITAIRSLLTDVHTPTPTSLIRVGADTPSEREPASDHSDLVGASIGTSGGVAAEPAAERTAGS